MADLKEHIKKGLKKAGTAYLDISKTWVENTGQAEMYNPFIPQNQKMEKDQDNNVTFAQRLNNNPFMKNPFYNPFVMLRDEGKKKSKK